MIRVLQVLEATEGGTRRHLRDLALGLDPEAFDVSLAVSFGRDPDFREDLAAYAAREIPVHAVPMRRGISPLRDALSLLSLVRLVRRQRPDLLHAHSAKAGFLARLAGALCRVPVVYTPHVFPFLMECGPLQERLYRGLERSVRRFTATLIGVSEEDAREALWLGYASDRVRLIRNGVAPVEAEIAAPAAREGGVPTVGFFGRLSRQKGPDLAVAAAAVVAARLPEATFVLYGDGELREELRAQAERLGILGRVQFRGPCAQGESVARMRETDVVLLPSRWEGCPYVVLEAFQAGVPVVAAAVGGVPELIRDGANGVLVGGGRAEAFGEALIELLRRPERRRRLAEGGRAALAAHDLKEMVEATAEVYRSAVGCGSEGTFGCEAGERGAAVTGARARSGSGRAAR